jgi:hypothetical protein
MHKNMDLGLITILALELFRKADAAPMFPPDFSTNPNAVIPDHYFALIGGVPQRRKPALLTISKEWDELRTKALSYGSPEIRLCFELTEAGIAACTPEVVTPVIEGEAAGTQGAGANRQGQQVRSSSLLSDYMLINHLQPTPPEERDMVEKMCQLLQHYLC